MKRRRASGSDVTKPQSPLQLLHIIARLRESAFWVMATHARDGMFGSKRVLLLTKLPSRPFAEGVLDALIWVLCAGAVVVALMNEGVL